MGKSFELGKFYLHSAGRAIAIIGKVETHRWGECLIAEETDNTGHSISIIEVGSEDTAEKWTEIGETEFMEIFNAPMVVRRPEKPSLN